MTQELIDRLCEAYTRMNNFEWDEIAGEKPRDKAFVFFCLCFFLFCIFKL